MKKPDAVTVIGERDFKEKVWPLPASELIYVGHATTRKLENYGIRTIGDIAKSSPEFLKRLLGVNGIALWRYAAGEDTSKVMNINFSAPVKSVGHGITCVSDLTKEEEVWKVMFELSQDIGHKLRLYELSARGVQLTVKDNKLMYKQYQAQLDIATQSPFEIAKKARELFTKNYDWNTFVRAVTVRAINLIPEDVPQQLNVFDDIKKRERREKLDDTVDELCRRFGKRTIYPASLMGNLKMPGRGINEVVMPGMMYK
jgi:DNA polymerase-4